MSSTAGVIIPMSAKQERQLEMMREIVQAENDLSRVEQAVAAKKGFF